MNEEPINEEPGVLSPRPTKKKLEPKTLMVLVSVFGGLGLLIALNMK